jgi:hypothetical protein
VKRKLKILAGILILLIVVIGISVSIINRNMAKSDREHERFYNVGVEIKGFIAEYGETIGEASRTKDVSLIADFYSDTYPSNPQSDSNVAPLKRGQWTWKAGEDGHYVSALNSESQEVTALKLTSEEPWLASKEEVADDFYEYLDGIESVQKIRSKIDMIEGIEGDASVVVRVKFILDGTTHDGQLFQDRHFYRWHAVKRDENWEIASDELLEGIRVLGDGQRFTELDLAAAGIDYKHQRNPNLNKEMYGDKLIFDVVEHSAGGASVVDFNNDGLLDIFFADGVRCRLYRNDGLKDPLDSQSLAYTDVTVESGLDSIEQAQAGFFGDINNDGFRDLFVTRYLAPNQFYRNNGNGTFTNQSTEMGLDFVATSTSACFLDYNRDGFLDLYVGSFGNAFKTAPRIPFFARNGEPNRLYRNNAGKNFTDVTKKSGTGDTGWSLAVAAGDYNNDGYPDLAVANDFGRKNLYRNNGDGTFSEVAKDAGVLDFSGGMGVTFGDFNDDGYLDLYTSNINSNQRWFGEDMTIHQYVRNVLRTKWALLDFSEFMGIYKLVGNEWTQLGKQVGEGNSLFENNGDGTFTELKGSHVNRAGWGWSVSFLDVDNDTDLDIYAANGWISNTPGSDL